MCFLLYDKCCKGRVCKCMGCCIKLCVIIIIAGCFAYIIFDAMHNQTRHEENIEQAQQYIAGNVFERLSDDMKEKNYTHIFAHFKKFQFDEFVHGFDDIVSKPTPKPTSKPTLKPTSKPTYKPTVKPTNKPTVYKPTLLRKKDEDEYEEEEDDIITKLTINSTLHQNTTDGSYTFTIYIDKDSELMMVIIFSLIFVILLMILAVNCCNFGGRNRFNKELKRVETIMINNGLKMDETDTIGDDETDTIGDDEKKEKNGVLKDIVNVCKFHAIHCIEFTLCKKYLCCHHNEEKEFIPKSKIHRC